MALNIYELQSTQVDLGGRRRWKPLPRPPRPPLLEVHTTQPSYMPFDETDTGAYKFFPSLAALNLKVFM